jgi:hypothetical protein
VREYFFGSNFGQIGGRPYLIDQLGSIIADLFADLFADFFADLFADFLAEFFADFLADLVAAHGIPSIPRTPPAGCC